KYNQELTDTIEELKKKEQALKEHSLLLLEQSKRAEIGEMIGNIAHQWRQPLAIINTSLAILKEKNKADMLSKEEIADKLQKMEKRVLYMSETIEDFMNYYTPDREKSYFNIKEAVEKALDIVNLKSNRSIHLNLLLNDTHNIYGQINEFVQVVVSILSNINDLIAIKKAEETNITISLYEQNSLITLIIKDDCGGIEEENLNKIFDPYFTTKHKSMGTGLGLHIAKMIIEDNMNGNLSAKNIYLDDGRKIGAEFIIRVKNES
ncbi:MAG: HAMP domain-containing sensor histidine kinase, partial [Sulfurimonas sp.]|nr:HAMP domain-containing sensor histidine kinase [Sulfurimonas sp.]